MILREIHSAISDVRQCLTALESVLPGNHGHWKGSSAVTMRVDHVLTFDADNKVEAEGTPLQRIKMSGNNSIPDLGHASSSQNPNAREVF